jgi:hypothetical protein
VRQAALSAARSEEAATAAQDAAAEPATR